MAGAVCDAASRFLVQLVLPHPERLTWDACGVLDALTGTEPGQALLLEVANIALRGARAGQEHFSYDFKVGKPILSPHFLSDQVVTTMVNAWADACCC
jgi:hypothetical protein